MSSTKFLQTIRLVVIILKWKNPYGQKFGLFYSFSEIFALQALR